MKSLTKQDKKDIIYIEGCEKRGKNNADSGELP
jgi:hypothetical protein